MSSTLPFYQRFAPPSVGATVPGAEGSFDNEYTPERRPACRSGVSSPAATSPNSEPPACTGRAGRLVLALGLFLRLHGCLERRSLGRSYHLDIG